MEGGDLQAFQLSSHVLGQLGIENGVLNRFHQHFGPDCEEEEYIAFLRVLEYDMLYGEHVIYEGESPYAPTDLRLGSAPIVCEYYTYRPGHGHHQRLRRELYHYSDILVDGERKNAVFADGDAPHRPRQRRNRGQRGLRGAVHPRGRGTGAHGFWKNA